MLMKSNKEEYVDLSDKKKNLNNVTPNKRGRANNTAFLYTSLGNKNSKTFNTFFFCFGLLGVRLTLMIISSLCYFFLFVSNPIFITPL